MARIVFWPFPVACIYLAALYLLARQYDTPSLELGSWTSSDAGFKLPAGSRLNLTLVGNELRYQEAVRERRTFIERLGGPDEAPFPAPFTAFYTLWDLFVPAFSCPFSVYRVCEHEPFTGIAAGPDFARFLGTMGDGGKWVCGLERVTHQSNCVIYSMGVERQSSFEQEILRQSERCQVYGFDFSVSEWGPKFHLVRPAVLPRPESTYSNFITSCRIRDPELRAHTEVNSRAHFYPWKIGGVDNHDANPKEYTLQGIMKEFGHDFIDIWKIDIEGSEFEAIESFKGHSLPFGQMQIEIHIGYAPDTNAVGAIDKWRTMLEDAGLRPFWTELNLLDVN